VTAIDGFIVNVSLPSIVRDLGGGLGLEQWTVDAYLLTLGALILVAGSLSDLFGRRRILTVGLIWFGLSSLLCAVAPDSATLVIARGLQGVGGALITPSSLALIISVFSGKAQSKAIGAWTAWLSVATVSGPIVGGLILSVASWRWIFVVSAAPIVITLWLLMRLDMHESTKTGARVDIPGAVLCVLGLGLPVYALIEQPTYGWGSTFVWLPLTFGILFVLVFLLQEKRTAQPMLPLSLFEIRNFSVGNMATLVIYAGLTVSTFLLTITLQQVGGYSPLDASLATVPVSVVMFLLSGRFGKLAGRYGPRLFMTLGPLTAGLGFLSMIRLQPHVNYLSELLPSLLLFALGLSATVAPLTSAVLGDIDPKRAGIASAVNNAIARIAGLVAVAAVGVITGPHLDIDGFRRVLLWVVSLMMIGAIASYAGIRNRVTSDRA